MNGSNRILTKHFRKFQLIGWIVLALPVVFSFLLPVAFASDLPEMPVTLVFVIFMIAAGLIAIGDALQLNSNRRRIRPVEIVQALAPMPIAVFFIYITFVADGGSSSFAKELVCFVMLMLVVMNMKGVYTYATMNREIVTCSEMKELERSADEVGLSYIEMMERAGTEAFGYICEEEIDMLKRMLVFCGSGNNGGDGFVVARLALEYGCDVTVVLACGMPKTPDAITNFELIRDRVHIIIPEEEDVLADLIDGALWGVGSDACKGNGAQPTEAGAQPTEAGAHSNANGGDLVIVDAIFGTGFHGTPEGFPRRAINYINDHRGINSIYALDVPSGLPGDLGRMDDAQETSGFYSAVYADCVITFHARKPVHTNPDLQDHMKKIIVADIGITKALEDYKLGI